MNGAVKKLEVRLTRSLGNERPVGTLVESGGRVYFEYDAAFLQQPLWLSPFKLPPRPGLLEHRDRSFGPLPGLFDDSLPDGWGLLLMDRYFRQQGRRPEEMTALDRLAYLGSRTMGTLTYHPPTDPDSAPQALDLGVLAEAAAAVLRGNAAEVLPQLLRAGGSPGGARPKVLVGVRGDELLSGEAELPADFEAWIVKFPAHQDDRDAGALEETYARMARRAGIHLPPTRLFATADGGSYFGVRRFDRQAGRRFHVHSFGNLIHADFRLPSCDYQQLLELTQALTRRRQDLLEQFRRAVFNVLAHNRDDHAKNFSFRFDDHDKWEISPAFDLVFAPGPGGEHTTTVAGEGKAPGRRHLFELAEKAGIEAGQAREICEEVAAAVSGFTAIASELGVAWQRVRDIAAAIDRCLCA